MLSVRTESPKSSIPKPKLWTSFQTKIYLKFFSEASKTHPPSKPMARTKSRSRNGDHITNSKTT